VPVQRYILNEKPAIDLAYVNTLNLRPENLVNEQVAAVILGKHRVTLRVWRRMEPPRGPAFIKDPSEHGHGDVRYRYADLLAWQDANRTDPSALTGDAEILYRNCMGSDRSRVQYETGETPGDSDVFTQEPM
jgi:hypothetical protein